MNGSSLLLLPSRRRILVSRRRVNRRCSRLPAALRPLLTRWPQAGDLVTGHATPPLVRAGDASGGSPTLLCGLAAEADEAPVLARAVSLAPEDGRAEQWPSPDYPCCGAGSAASMSITHSAKASSAWVKVSLLAEPSGSHGSVRSSSCASIGDHITSNWSRTPAS